MQMDDMTMQQNDELTRQAQALTTEIENLKQENETLRLELQQFRSYLDIANATITTISPEGIVSYISSNWSDVLGYYPTEDSAPFSFQDSVHPDDLELCRECLKKVFNHGTKQVDIEYRIRHKDGIWRWLRANTAPLYDKDGKLVSALAIAWDITEQKELELKLQSSNEKFRLLFDTMREGVIIVDNDDITQFVNRSCCEIFGFTEHELIGRPGNECFIHEEDRHIIIDKNKSRVHGVADEYELRGTKKNGELVWLRINGAPLRDKDGKVIGSVGIMTDITESKALKEQLLASQKMEAIGKLAGGIAHDFNNLLNIILGYSDELRDALPPDSPLRIGADEIVKAGERAAGLTRQLLIFSRKQIVKPRVVDVNELLSNLNTMLHTLIAGHIDIHLTLDNSLTPVKIDPGQLELVIVNLAINSKEAMPKGGSFSIETSNLLVDKDNLHSRPDIKPGQYVQLRISDTGCGMAEDILGRIFEPFFSTKGIGSGVGLGLSTVYGIVAQSGGYILVTSEPGKGTCFTILLPASTEPVGRTSPQNHELRLLGKGEHILIVEDEKALLSYFAKLIKNLGYKVSACSESMEALELIRQGLKPDLMITDVVMPKLNGRQLADKVMELIPQQKLLFMSGFTDDAIVQYEVCEQGMPFIQKPFNSKDIAIQIRHLLDGSISNPRSANIFMLDDEDGIRHLFERACLKRGHSFTGAATLQEALTALAGQQFDVLLIDMQLVGMNGTQALQKIREEKINTPAIVLTGAVRPEYREALKHLGVIKTVEKSFDNLPLLKYIEELISGS